MTAYEGYSLQNGLVPLRAEIECVGTGKSGAVKGMVGHWSYEMDYDGTPESFHWDFTGNYH